VIRNDSWYAVPMTTSTVKLRILITGASRGLGLELVRQYLETGAQVFAAARQPAEGELARLAPEHGQQLTLIPLDVTRDDQRQAAVETVQSVAGALDVLVNNAGSNAKGVGLGAYTDARMLELMHVNAVAPIMIGQAFLGLLGRGTAAKLINVSTQVGSFTWNQTGTSPMYAASKAALNMYTRAFAREAKGVTTIAVHPGWVKTDMGGPSATLTPAESARSLRRLIARLTPGDNGQFFNHDGSPHPW
jgi:NAD(P)-dependent dehydrogenase (short-subunit alcohol dehydrogenase family)